MCINEAKTLLIKECYNIYQKRKDYFSLCVFLYTGYLSLNLHYKEKMNG